MSSSATRSEEEIPILIARDHPIVREGLIAVFTLEDDLIDRADPSHPLLRSEESRDAAKG